jgi:hypothetical protein
MSRTTAGLWVLLMASSGVGYACGSSDESAFANGAPDERGSDASAGEPADNGAFGAGKDVGLTDNAVILVHAAKSQPYRLCFASELDRRPLPDSQVMPEANVVGVEVGSAVRLPPLRGKPGDVYLFDEPLIRAYYPSGKGPTCSNLLSSKPTAQLAIKLGAIDSDFSTGVHLLALTGCAANTPVATYSTDECGADWTPAKGNLALKELELGATPRSSSSVLPTQVINLSQALETERAAKGSVSVTFGPLVGTTPKPVTVATDLPLFGKPAPAVSLPFDLDAATVYDTLGFQVRVTGGDAGTETVLSQSLLEVQRLSSPRDVPTSFYSVASSYVLLVLGDPTLPDGGREADNLKSLHLVAIPVVEPKADAGADAQAP